jgi:hypothetical protein
MKKIFLLTIAALLLTFSSFAQTSGTTGSLTWSFSDNGTLTISGTGVMPDYDLSISNSRINPKPWSSFQESITQVVIEEGVSNIGSSAFSTCTKLTSVTFPSAITSIGDEAFGYCESLISVDIPAGVTSIGDWAFIFCRNLTSVTLPEGLESIGQFAFCGCTKLSLVIPSTVISIGTGAFSGVVSVTYLNEDYPKPPSTDISYNEDQTILYWYPAGREDTEFTIPGSVKVINSKAFKDCKNLISVIIPESVEHIGDYAFSGCSNLTSALIPGNVSYVGMAAFAGCALDIITIPEKLIKIYDSTFERCSHPFSVTIPGNIRNIGFWSFAYSAVTSVVICEGVESIEDFAFAYCDDLTSVTIPSSVVYIGKYAFAKTSDIEVGWDIPLTVSRNIFDDNLSQNTLYVPKGSKSLYEQAPVWKDFGSIIEKASGITAIDRINKDAIEIKPVSNGISIASNGIIPVSIYNILGQKVYQSILTGKKEIPLEKGIYIVKTDKESVKVLIK